MAAQQEIFDFIVVGSGAGDGVLASRLARNNKNLKVLLIEAGSNPSSNIHYQVPGFIRSQPKIPSCPALRSER